MIEKEDKPGKYFNNASYNAILAWTEVVKADEASGKIKPEAITDPNKKLNIILGIAFGLLVGVGLAFFIEYLDTSVKTIDDVERALQAREA